MARMVFNEGIALFNRVMWLGIALVFSGAGMVDLGSAYAAISHALQTNGVVTAGTVTNRYVQESSKGHKTFMVQYSYSDKKGYVYRSEVEVGQAIWSAASIGFKFYIIYDPLRPVNSIFPGFDQYYEYELICMVGGWGLIFPGLFTIIGWIRERRRRIRFIARLKRSKGAVLNLTSLIRRSSKRNIEVPAIEYEYYDENGAVHQVTSEIQFKDLWKERIEDGRNKFELFYDSDTPSDHIFTELNSAGNLVRRRCLQQTSVNVRNALFYIYMFGLWLMGFAVYSFKDYLLPVNAYVLVFEYFMNIPLIIGFWVGISFLTWCLLRCVNNEIQFQDVKNGRKLVRALVTAVLEEESFTFFRTPGSKKVHWLQYEYSDKPGMTRYGMCQLASQVQAFDFQDCLAHGENNIEVFYDPIISNRHFIVDRRFISLSLASLS